MTADGFCRHERRRIEQNRAFQLGGETGGREVPLVDVVGASVSERASFDRGLVREASSPCLFDDHDRGRDPLCLGDELASGLPVEVTVEVAAEDQIEGVARERQGWYLGTHEHRAG
jgi:hypothetical protein